MSQLAIAAGYKRVQNHAFSLFGSEMTTARSGDKAGELQFLGIEPGLLTPAERRSRDTNALLRAKGPPYEQIAALEPRGSHGRRPAEDELYGEAPRARATRAAT